MFGGWRRILPPYSDEESSVCIASGRAYATGGRQNTAPSHIIPLCQVSRETPGKSIVNHLLSSRSKEQWNLNIFIIIYTITSEGEDV